MDAAHGDRAGPVGEEWRQQRERRVPVDRLDAPPQVVTAGKARAVGRPVAQRALEPVPGCEGRLAGRSVVAVMEEEERHPSRLSRDAVSYIRGSP
jgi:hypothetical protein